MPKTGYLKALREETSHLGACRLPIQAFYIPLTHHSLPLEDVLMPVRRALIVGGPGSGKSTFLKWVAFGLCTGRASNGALPVLIEAAALSSYIEKRRATEPASPTWISLFLEAQSEENGHGMDAGDFRAHLESGRCRVLIDGLDETPDKASREHMVKLIGDAARLYESCQFVVTSRPEGKTGLEYFTEVGIGDLEPDAVRAFLAKLAKQWYATDEEQERHFRDELLTAMKGRPEIRAMTRNPMTLMALVAWRRSNTRLPSSRSELYESMIEWISEGQCLPKLRKLALAMQNHEDGRRKRVPLEWAAGKLAEGLADRDATEEFLRTNNGILESCGSEVGFLHLPFQEYLAALELASWKSVDSFKLLLGRSPKIHKPEWHETVLLYGAQLCHAGADQMSSFLGRVLDTMGKQPTLANRAKCVGLIGALLLELPGYRLEDARYEESWRLVMDIFNEEGARLIPFKDRLAAAEALGQTGDPRLTELEWVTIPATKDYWIGAQPQDPRGRNYDPAASSCETLRRVALPPFRIAKYPVTVAQYEAFVADGPAPNREPACWERQRAHRNRPVVGVSWHQAVAYCGWVGGRLPSEDEWERAARGPSGTRYPWGNEEIDPSRANYGDSHIGHPTPVGLYPSGRSVEGACDLLGNVWEWTSSKWPEGVERYEVRGGSFDAGRRGSRASFRFNDDLTPDGLYASLGFRVAADVATPDRSR